MVGVGETDREREREREGGDKSRGGKDEWMQANGQTSTSLSSGEGN